MDIYELPEEIKDMFADAEAYEDCRDSCIKNFFGWKRSHYFAKKCNETKVKAWNSVYSIYPETKHKKMSYDNILKELTELSE